MLAKGSVGAAKCLRLHRRDLVIVEQLGTAENRNLVVKAAGFESREFRYGVEVDVKWIEEQSTTGRIRARLPGRQRMQRIQSHTCRPNLGGDLNQKSQIGEIAVSPIVVRTDRIKLHGKEPSMAKPATECRLVGHWRRYQDRERSLRPAVRVERQPIAPDRQVLVG